MLDWSKRGSPRVLAVRLFVLGMMVATVGGSALFNSRPSSHSAKGDFQKGIQPLFTKYCYECHNDTKHKGGFSLQAYPDGAFIREHREVWAELLRKVRTREMPPEGKPQPTEKERERIVSWVEADLFPVNYDNPDPGRVTIRRLNRAEYNNTVRDLLGIDFHPADDFPNDDTGYGFDNIGDVLSLSPLLLEKYVTAAEEIMETVLTNEVAEGPALYDEPGRWKHQCLP